MKAGMFHKFFWSFPLALVFLATFSAPSPVFAQAPAEANIAFRLLPEKTDVKGGENNGIDVLYVSGGIHAREYGEGAHQPEPARLAAFLEKHGHHPVAVIPRLR